MKEFFLKFFEKSIEKEVRIYLPLDCIVTKKVEFEDTIRNEEENAVG